MKQRTRKYRAWDTINKKMHLGVGVSNEGEAMILVSGEGMAGSDSHVETYRISDGLILSEWIGLRDKRGQMIYEGDICENGDWEEDAHTYNYRIEEVKYIEDEAAFYGYNDNMDGMTCEVIGNIYENPELLK